MEIGKIVGSIINFEIKGGLAQLARALAWHARGRRFDPDTLHKISSVLTGLFYAIYRIHIIFW
jgi:hypothetical protein